MAHMGCPDNMICLQLLEPNINPGNEAGFDLLTVCKLQGLSIHQMARNGYYKTNENPRIVITFKNTLGQNMELYNHKWLVDTG